MLVVQQERHRLGEFLVELELYAGVAVVKEVGVAFRGESVRREIEDQHERALRVGENGHL
jgi:hypothetical protein